VRTCGQHFADFGLRAHCAAGPANLCSGKNAKSAR
jgi:hypothetical protein